MNIKKIIVTKIHIIKVHAKFALEWQTIDWNHHPHLSSQHNNTHDHFPLSTLTTFPTFLSSPNYTSHVSMSSYPCWLDVYSFFFKKKSLSWFSIFLIMIFWVFVLYFDVGFFSHLRWNHIHISAMWLMWLMS